MSRQGPATDEPVSAPRTDQQTEARQPMSRQVPATYEPVIAGTTYQQPEARKPVTPRPSATKENDRAPRTSSSRTTSASRTRSITGLAIEKNRVRPVPVPKLPANAEAQISRLNARASTPASK